MAKYTFILPAYKEDFLAQAIDSILSQTFQDFIILVSNDCSPENIEDIVNKYNDSRIQYRCNKTNIGGKDLALHWNLLLKLINSEYFVVASDDDIYEPTFLEEVDRLTKKYPEVNLIRAGVRRIDSKGKTTWEEFPYNEYLEGLNAEKAIYCQNYISCIGNYAFKTEAIRRINGFYYYEYAWFSDIFTVTTLAQHGMACTNQISFNFRISQSNISGGTHSRDIDRGKLDAVMRYDKQMADFCSKIIVRENALDSNLFKFLVHAYKTNVYLFFGYYAWSVSLLMWFKLYNQLRHVKYFSRYSFLKQYTKTLLARKIGKVISLKL